MPQDPRSSSAHRTAGDVAIRSTQRLIAQNRWRGRVYDANYRGDWVTQVEKRSESSSRRRAPKKADGNTLSLTELFEAKNSVCRDYVIRLADDRVPGSFYVDKAIEHCVPLFMGIGATQIDRHSIVDLEAARDDIRAVTTEHVDAIRTVAQVHRRGRIRVKVASLAWHRVLRGCQRRIELRVDRSYC